MADVTTPFGFPYPEPTDLVRDGATDIEALAEGVNDQFLAGFLFAGQRIYESDGTFAKADPLGTGDIGLRAIRVRVVGGGGGAGLAESTGAGQEANANSGGGGGFAEKFIADVSVLAASETVSRGAGGTGGVTGSAASSGGVSSFGSHLSATGGRGGNAGLTASGFFRTSGGGGGSGTNGDVNVDGSASGPALLVDGQRLLTSFTGASVLSGTQRQLTGDGADGLLSGGGGLAPASAPNTAERPGGAGGNGVVIVEVFV